MKWGLPFSVHKNHKAHSISIECNIWFFFSCMSLMVSQPHQPLGSIFGLSSIYSLSSFNKILLPFNNNKKRITGIPYSILIIDQCLKSSENMCTPLHQMYTRFFGTHTNDQSRFICLKYFFKHQKIISIEHR